MFRYRWSCQVIYGKWGEFYGLQEAKAVLAAQRGWVPARFWIATAGTHNDFFLERDYESLEDLSIELCAREDDYEFMKLMRESYKLAVQGSIRIELFQTAVASR